MYNNKCKYQRQRTTENLLENNEISSCVNGLYRNQRRKDSIYLATLEIGVYIQSKSIVCGFVVQVTLEARDRVVFAVGGSWTLSD